MHKILNGSIVALLLIGVAIPTNARDEIGEVSTTFRFFGANDKIKVAAVDDPKVEGVSCWYSAAQTGGISGSLGLAEDPSDASLACRQVGPIRFKNQFKNGEDVQKESRNIFFKSLQIVRFCDVKRNTLVYLVYSDKLVDGSPKNALSTVPIQPWGSSDAVKCQDNLKK